MGEQEEYIAALEQRHLADQAEKNTAQANLGSMSMYGSNTQENLVQWQLDMKEELERIEHMLKGHILQTQKNGDVVYVDPPNAKYKPFNDYGVQLIMNVISFYLNRNTILSNYDEEMINIKMHDLGDEIADLIFMKYEEMGMDDEEKQKLYPMIVRQLVDTIHSAYLRAMNGGERDSLRTARHVVQNQPIGGSVGYPSAKKKFSIVNPGTWGNG